MSEGDSVGDSVHGKPSVVYRFFTRLGQIYQSWLDKSTPYTAVRWVVTLGLSFVYMIRVYLLQGWYIVTYALGIYHLNLFIAFLSPKVDPSLMEDSDDGPSLPTKQNEEFRPFIRRLPEFKFCIKAVTSSVMYLLEQRTEGNKLLHLYFAFLVPCVGCGRYSASLPSLLVGCEGHQLRELLGEQAESRQDGPASPPGSWPSSCGKGSIQEHFQYGWESSGLGPSWRELPGWGATRVL
ncbi:protein RER1 isoform X1 [Canis lupus baileyi]|uniref:protein RER1 isoform X1 n=1 Tax=Canis lupus baileyi TaxID=143281 RepID=UPI003B9740D2